MRTGAPDAVTGCLRYGTLRKVKSFPAEVRKEPGKAVFDLQRGQTLAMPLSRPMPSIALGAEELRIRDRAGIYRVFCYARLARGVLVFHAFTRKTQSTPKNELAMGKKRLKELLED
jgi:phage-related protein